MTDHLRQRLAQRRPGYPYTLGRTLAIYAGLMATILLAALDQTIVATAMPVIVGDLGGLTSYPWVFTAFLLCSTVTVPIYGRLGDVYGRRRLFFVSIPMFLIGSALCGLAQNMPELIVFRGLQGLGAGGVIPLAMATTAQIVPPRDRGRYAALISSAFATASILGPTVGGLIVDNTSWRWIFYINLPVGSLALLVIGLTMPRQEKREPRPVDWTGAALLAVATTSLLLGVLGEGRPYAWIAFAVLAPVFVVRTRRIPEPLVPIRVVAEPIVAAGALGTGLFVMCQFGATIFVPLFAQGVLGVSATSSGIVLIPQTLGAVGATILTGQWIARTGRYRGAALLGPIVLGGSMLLLASMGTGTTTLEVGAFMILAGVGTGLLGQTFMLAGQNAVELPAVGSATSVIQFSRALGTTIGVAIFGAIIDHGLPSRLRGQTTVHLLAPAGRVALAHALRPAFLFGAALCLVVLGAVLFGLKERPLRVSIEDEPIVDAGVPAAGAGAASAFADHERRHLTLHPTGGVSAGSGASPPSTDSSASRR